MKSLVDANVLSEPTKPSPDLRIVDWLQAQEPDIAVDPVILGELRFGILILPRGKKRMALERWFDAGVGPPLPSLGRRYGLEMGRTAGAPPQSWNSHADQRQLHRSHGDCLRSG